MIFRQSVAGGVPVLPVTEERGFCFPPPCGWVWLLLALLSACGGRSDASEHAGYIVDDVDRPVAVAPPARRIVSVSPAVTELLIALGAADRLVARTAWDADVRLAGLPSLGPALTPGVESLLEFRPDLVITSAFVRGQPLAASLEPLGIRSYVADVQSVAGILQTAGRLGVLLGLEARADSLVGALREQLDAVRRQAAGRPRLRVLYLVWPSPAQTVGPDTYIDELIRIAGGRNIFGDAHAPWFEVSVEEILRRNPDVIVLPQSRALGDSAAHRLADAGGWRTLEAVRKGRIVRVDDDLFSRPGPRVAEAARTLAAALEPLRRQP